MKTRRQQTNQDAQRAKHKHRRRFRGPAEAQHGGRSQSGVKIRSVAAWKRWSAGHDAKVKENVALDKMKAEWRTRARNRT